MLFNLEPDRSVTGGAWYSDQDFESEFVEVLNQQCYKFLQQKVSLLILGRNNTQIKILILCLCKVKVVFPKGTCMREI